MKRNTHSDRATAWASKQSSMGYKTKTHISAADLLRHKANESSLIDTKEVLSKVETIEEED